MSETVWFYMLAVGDRAETVKDPYNRPPTIESALAVLSSFTVSWCKLIVVNTPDGKTYVLKNAGGRVGQVSEQR